MAKGKKVNVKSKSSNGTGNAVLCSILCYFVIGIAWYFIDEKLRKNALAKRHANQGLFLILAYFVGTAAFWVFAHLPIIGSLLGEPIYVAAKIVFFFFWLFGLVQAVVGQNKPIIFIGKFAEQLNL